MGRPAIERPPSWHNATDIVRNKTAIKARKHSDVPPFSLSPPGFAPVTPTGLAFARAKSIAKLTPNESDMSLSQGDIRRAIQEAVQDEVNNRMIILREDSSASYESIDNAPMQSENCPLPLALACFLLS